MHSQLFVCAFDEIIFLHSVCCTRVLEQEYKLSTDDEVSTLLGAVLCRLPAAPQPGGGHLYFNELWLLFLPLLLPVFPLDICSDILL